MFYGEGHAFFTFVRPQGYKRTPQGTFKEAASNLSLLQTAW